MRINKIHHFCFILAIMVFGALIYYTDQIPWLQTVIPKLPIQLARYSTYRILSIIPVAYAAFVFGFRGGVVTLIFVSLALLPRALFYALQVNEAVLETIAFFLIGLLISWLIHRQQRTVRQLEIAQRELQSNLEVIKRNDERLTVLNQISDTVSESLELSTVLSNAIDNVVAVMQVDVAWIYVLDEKTNELSLEAHRGSSEELTRGVDRIKVGEGFNGRVARSGQPLYVEDASKDARLTREVISKFKLHSTLIVPLRSKSKVNGTLCVAMHNYQKFQPDDVELLTVIGNHIGVAVDNANLYSQQRTIMQQLQISEERYRGIFENSSDAIFVCSTAARIISVNQACEQLTGLNESGLTSMAINELFEGESRKKVEQFFSGNLALALSGSTEEVSLIRQEGNECFIKLKCSPLFKQNDIIGLQIIAQDVTEEKQLRQNMEYYIKQVTRAQEDERLRISRELHDDTAQLLATLSRDLDSIIVQYNNKEGKLKNQLKRLHSMANSALEGVRRFSQALRPSILDDLGLVPALEWLVADLENSQNISIVVKVSGTSRRLTQETELAVFRIAQEVFSNIRRHSNATSMEMTLDFGHDALTLVISDNGKGFTIPERTSDLALSGKLGIIGMRERARLIGGTLIVKSEPDIGTTIILRIPV